MASKDFVVRFAGEGGQGMVTSAEALAAAAAQVGYHVQTFATFPSQIEGGPTWTQVRISVIPVLSSGDALDVLVAFNKEAYDGHKGELRDGGILVYDSAAFQPPEEERGSNSLALPFNELGKSTGNPRAANMVILGAIAQFVEWPEAYLEQFNIKRFNRGRAGDEAVIQANSMALKLGRDAGRSSGFSLGQLAAPQPPQGQQILLKGNEAVALGAIAAGLDFFVGYPISPATAILVFMESNLHGPGKFVYQASSEIETINALVGGGYAGKKAMTSTSGPGFSLMHEGLGMAWTAEIPCVVVNVQRGGPATGLPTKTEQSDLLSALHPGHGDMTLPVIAPGTVEECFYAGATALNWAERYQGPVMLLSEMMLAERNQNIPKPDLSKVVDERRKVYTGSNGYQRYEAHELSPMPIPGGPGSYVANASEHDGIGDTTHLPQRHIHMTERRFSKLKLLEDGTYERKNAHHPVAVLPWGGSKGPTQEAYETLMQQGLPLGWYYTMYLSPMPPRLLEELRTKELVLVPELNYLGQLSMVLRSQGVRAESITQYTGLPFKVGDLVGRITERVKAHYASREKVKVGVGV
ncbi:MAG: 2-oxoacid:acceptor oxidoreductase subunit alpha [Chloroflexi bacterium]|nr:2-oxoacid:acceptor oxidoreductase subunit alpha [Chloroflexota bacterium]